VTHYVMKGFDPFSGTGKLSVPWEERQEFHRCIEEYLREEADAKGFPALVEKVDRRGFTFFIDVDIPRKIEPEGMLELVRTCHGALTDAAICSAKACERENKTGLHIIFNDLIVNSVQAQEKLRRVVDAVKERMAKDKDFEKLLKDLDLWSVFDVKPYSTGLRMVFMSKERCTCARSGGACTCVNRETSWPMCGSVRYEDGMLHVSFYDMELMAERGVDWFEMFSIAVPPHVAKEHGERTRPSVTGTFASVRGGSGVQEYLESAIQKNYASPSPIKLQNVLHKKNGNNQRVRDVYVLTTRCRWCAMANREHHSNHIYFVLDVSEPHAHMTGLRSLASDNAWCTPHCHDADCRGTRAAPFPIGDRVVLADFLKKICPR